MDFTEQWESILADSFNQFADIAVDHQDIDLTYGFAATAVLWPVREQLDDDEGVDSLFELCGPKANQIFRAIRNWDDDLIEASSELATATQENEKLRRALDLLLQRFNAVNTFTEQLAQKVAEQQGGGDVTTIAGEINAAIVNIGGTTTIQSLQLNITPKVEIPPPPQPVQPPEAGEFIGRESEIAYFMEKLHESHLALLIGMAGVGKTAMASVLAHQYAKYDKIFWHSFHEREGIETIIWKLAGFLAWHGQDELWRMLNITQQTGGQTQTAENLFEYVIELIRNQNYLLCFDDFQFVDDDPRLNQLVKRLREAVFAGELAIIITSRRIPRYEQTVEFDPLEGLSADDSAKLLERQGLALSDELMAELHLHTGGNAQLLRLTINALQDEDDPADLINRLSETDDIERYLLNEVDESLTGDEKDVMGVIALLLGYPGSFGVIETILDTRGVRRSLRRLSDRHLLIITDGEYGKEYRQHSIVQGFYYDLFAKQKRKEMHRQAADFYSREEPDLLKTTLHSERGGDVERAAKLATENVRTFINLGQARPLKSILERFREKQFNDKSWIQLNIAKGRIYALLGERDRAKMDYRDAHSQLQLLPKEKGFNDLNTQICLGMGELLERENPDEAINWLNKGLLTKKQSDTNRNQASLYLQRGTIRMAAGNYHESLNDLKAGLDILPSGCDQLRAKALRDIGAVYLFYQGEIGLAEENFSKAFRISEQIQDHFLAAQIAINQGIAGFISGDWSTGVANLKKALEKTIQLGSQESQAGIMLNLGTMHTYLGNNSEALAYLKNCIEQANENNLLMVSLDAYSRLADLYIRQRKYDEAINALNKTEKLTESLNFPENTPLFYISWAEIELGRNKIQDAQQLIQKALAIAFDEGAVIEEGIALRVSGQIYAKEANYSRAIEVFEKSLEVLGSIDPYEVARTNYSFGIMLCLTPDIKRGESLLKEAEGTFRKLGALLDLAMIPSGFPHQEKGK